MLQVTLLLVFLSSKCAFSDKPIVRQAIDKQESFKHLPPWLPHTSVDFEKFFCGAKIIREFSSNNDAFVRWVISARHTTWTDGWSVPIANTSSDAKHVSANKYYARVFDILNWSRSQHLLPRQIHIDKVCHKGMEVMFGYNSEIRIEAAPTKPNQHIPDETWATLWNTCQKQLNANERISSSCIDIPSVVVHNPFPPFKINNPCHYEFRMIDGAHRVCLRKYFMSLMEGELIDYRHQLAVADDTGDISASNNIKAHITNLQNAVVHLGYGSFFILNQTTFESMLIDLDPHISWAKDENVLMKDIADGLRYDWSQWMQMAMAHASFDSVNLEHPEL